MANRIIEPDAGQQPWICSAQCNGAPVCVYNDCSYNKHESGQILKINIRKSCSGIRSFRRPVGRSLAAAASIHRSLATAKANNWRRTSDVCGPVPSDHPAVSMPVIPPRSIGTVLVSVRRRASRGFARLPFIVVWHMGSYIVAPGSIPALLAIFNWFIAASCRECHIFIRPQVACQGVLILSVRMHRPPAPYYMLQQCCPYASPCVCCIRPTDKPVKTAQRYFRLYELAAQSSV